MIVSLSSVGREFQEGIGLLKWKSGVLLVFI